MTDDGLVGRDVGGFRLAELLGRGAKASVYRGESIESPGVIRAIKVIHPALVDGRDFVVRLLDEATVLARLQHPHVERCYDVRRDNGLLLMELELLEGQSVADLLAQQRAPGNVGGLPFDRALDLAHEAALGVAEAHRRGVVHGDLELANLFVTESDGLKVRDFAVARLFAEIERARGNRRATSEPSTRSWAPEVRRGNAPSPAADVYALGLCLYEMVLGHHPATRPSASDEVGSSRPPALAIEFPSVAAARPEAPATLDAVLRKATAADPDDRYPTARELGKALASIKLGAGGRPHPGEMTQLVAFRYAPTSEKELPPTDDPTEPVSSGHSSTAPPALVAPVSESIAPPPPRPPFPPGGVLVGTRTTLPSAQRATEMPAWVLPASVAVLAVITLFLAYRNLVPARGSLVIVATENEQMVEDVPIVLDNFTVCQNSPCRVEGLEPGTHFIKASGPRYRAEPRPVEIVAGQQAKVLLVVKRLPPAADAPPVDLPKDPAPPPGPPRTSDDGAFPRSSALIAMARAGMDAASCAQPNGPSGSSRIAVEFAPTGVAVRATLAEGSFSGTPTGACIEKHFAKLKLPPFGGPPITVNKTINIPAFEP